jgi:hypothetical protein
MGMLQMVMGMAQGVVGVFGADAKRNELATNMLDNVAELELGVDSENKAAADAASRGGHNVALARRRASGVTAAQRVAFAANNVDASSGTAAKLQDAAMAAGEEDADTLRANALAEALGHKTTAEKYGRDIKRVQRKAKTDIDNVFTDLIFSSTGRVAGMGASAASSGGS